MQIKSQVRSKLEEERKIINQHKTGCVMNKRRKERKKKLKAQLLYLHPEAGRRVCMTWIGIMAPPSFSMDRGPADMLTTKPYLSNSFLPHSPFFITSHSTARFTESVLKPLQASLSDTSLSWLMIFLSSSSLLLACDSICTRSSDRNPSLASPDSSTSWVILLVVLSLSISYTFWEVDI